MNGGGALDLSAWGLKESSGGSVCLIGHTLTDIARRWGTPLHVVDTERLRTAARRFRELAEEYVGHTARVHYACKCNGVPGTLAEIAGAGLNIEVMSAFELATSLRVGFTPDRIIVNGPCKNVPFLTAAVDAQVRLIVVDSLAEMNRLEQIARTSGTRPSILMRVNPDIRVRGLNKGSSTGSRKHCAFGLDVRSGEVEAALDLVRYSNLKFTGFHAHIGSGIREPGAYTRLVAAFDTLIRLARRKGLVVDCLDLGGGFPAPTSREFHSSELLAYQAFGRLPSCGPPPPTLQQFFETFGPSLRSCLRDHGITSVIFEPGRSIVSNAQLLLLTVEYIKRRAGTPSWVITDGGLGTVTLPTYYEYHEIIPALHPNGPEQEPFTILGPGCFAADIVVRNKNLPPINPGDVLAVMDSGAYFTSMESNFGYPRPAIVAVDSDGQSLWRERESHDYYIQRDIFRTCCQEERP